MDKSTRNLIQKAAQDARGLLEAEFSEQLSGVFDIRMDGTIEPEPGKHLDEKQKVLREKLVAAVEHEKAAGISDVDAVAAYLREAAFTALNRFVALKMLEARGLVQECVSKGEQSLGFKEFCGLAPGLADLSDHGYRLYLESLFDELGTEIRVLFDRRDPVSLLWPRRKAQEVLLSILNRYEIAGIWGEDETIGWVYQYFNSSEERKKMRDESAAPRNSRELAVRNQFFTPRYVVEFLTDNTLGRAWYEMRQGKTRLKDSCQYLVRRPNEVYMKEGETPLEETEKELENLSHEELLKSPHYIPFREKKDPRDIKILDPACGSGHFLLYAFDLLLEIFEEGWEDPVAPKSEATGNTLKEDYMDIESLQAAVPGLILRHNLHGIDIDPRAVQIAALSLWMRAQKGYSAFNIERKDRPAIKKTNVVTAEPMPGEKEMLREFTETLRPRFMGQLVESVFEKMLLTGEAGSLLKIDEDIREAIKEAKKQKETGPRRQTKLFPQDEATETIQENLWDVSDISDDSFWVEAEDRIYNALAEYSGKSKTGREFQRKLFTEDSIKGFAYIDINKISYDVILMNPPFGAAIEKTKDYIKREYPFSKQDVFACFIDRYLSLLEYNGSLGAITSRTCFFINSFEEWRSNVILGKSFPSVVVDLGYGVLDAMVETAAYCLSKVNQNSLFIRAIDSIDKKSRISDTVKSIANFKYNKNVFIVNPNDMMNIPGHPIAYWVSNNFRELFSNEDNFFKDDRSARVGLQTSDDFRFVRLFWEVPDEGLESKWFPFAKGGEYCPFYSDIHLFVNWAENGVEIKNFVNPVSGKLKSRPQNLEFYFRCGITWPERTTSGFSPQLLPEGCVISQVGLGMFINDKKYCLSWLSLLHTRVYQYIIELLIGLGEETVSGSAGRHYTSGLISNLPFPLKIIQENKNELVESAILQREASKYNFTYIEESIIFNNFDVSSYGSISDAYNNILINRLKKYSEAIKKSEQVENIIRKSFKLTQNDIEDIIQVVGHHPVSDLPKNKIEEAKKIILENANKNIDQIIDGGVDEGLTTRSVTKKSYFISRYHEVLALIGNVSAADILDAHMKTLVVDKLHLAEFSNRILSIIIGLIFGRWDIRIFLNSSFLQNADDPFDKLSARQPCLLIGPDGRPAKKDNIASEEWIQTQTHLSSPQEKDKFKNFIIPDCQYPVHIAWEGIIVDDPGFEGKQFHEKDIIFRAREVLEILWKDKALDIEQEACEIVNTPDLRSYFRKSFFSDHIKRYSKSRRKAPIYWQLSTPSASYSVWLYYHRFTKDTFYKVLNDHVVPKLLFEQRELNNIRQQYGPEPTAGQRKKLDARETFVAELKTFKEEVARIAPLWNLNLNDGVIINFAPLWRLVPQNKPWQKECKKVWDKLVKGEYDWAHLSMHLWPERVVPKCAKDRSLAIAHGLEEAFWEENDKGKWKPKKVSKEAKEALVHERTSPTVKAALEELLKAPVPASATRKRRKKKA